MMPSFEDSDNGIYALGRIPGRFQVSRRIKKGEPDEPDSRYAYEVCDSADEVAFSSDDGWKTVIRETRPVSG